jgi:hypothetical protein
LLDEEIHNFYTPTNITVTMSRRKRWMGHVACMEAMRNAHRIAGKRGARRPFGRSRYKWEDNIRMDLREQGGNV